MSQRRWSVRQEFLVYLRDLVVKIQFDGAHETRRLEEGLRDFSHKPRRLLLSFNPSSSVTRSETRETNASAG